MVSTVLSLLVARVECVTCFGPTVGGAKLASVLACSCDLVTCIRALQGFSVRVTTVVMKHQDQNTLGGRCLFSSHFHIAVHPQTRPHIHVLFSHLREVELQKNECSVGNDAHRLCGIGQTFQCTLAVAPA